jgi:hypothetical protein
MRQSIDDDHHHTQIFVHHHLTVRRTRDGRPTQLFRMGASITDGVTFDT